MERKEWVPRISGADWMYRKQDMSYFPLDLMALRRK